MKKFKVLGVFLILFISVGIHQIVSAKDIPRVLLFITDGSPELEFMLTKEVGVMRNILEQSGFEVDITTVAGESISVGSVRLDTVLKLANVNTDDYAGFIIPCMGVSERDAPEIESVIKKAVEAGKPVAAQLGGVKHLARAGVLEGKKYAYRMEVNLNAFPEFKGAIYFGTGVVKDGNIITSGLCPLWAREEGLKDSTPELTQALIEALKTE